MQIYGIQKNGTDEPRVATEMQTVIKDMDTVGEGEGGTNSENNTETYTLARGNLPYATS